MKSSFFDIIIPVHKKDLSILEYAISHARKNIIGARRIIVISKERHSNNAEWYDEAKFPFSFQEISKFTNGVDVGWHFQQFLKMYAPLVIPDIAENVLILDSDTVFFKKVKMLSSDGKPYVNLAQDKVVSRNSFDLNIANHIKRIYPPIAKENLPADLKEFSGVTHHMMFNRDILIELFKKIEDFYYEKFGIRKKFYEIAMEGYHLKKEMELSEYQIYFNYLIIFHRSKIILRKLRFKNTADQNIARYRYHPKYHYCSFHHYLRGTKTKCKKIRALEKIKGLFQKLFFIERWNVGIANCNIAEFLKIPNQQINWLKPRCKFRADPFGFIDKNGAKQIFFEGYGPVKRKGEIRKIIINDALEIIDEKIILENNFHLSYPYIFCDGDSKYAFVEAWKSNGLDLYKIDENGNFIKEKRILDNLKIVDPSIIKFENKWWLFFCLADKGEDKLYLYYSDDLCGQWHSHKNNPVKIDIKSSRPGGEIFYHENEIYRPSQNCSTSYGGSLTINKIKKLTIDEFAEEWEINMTPDQIGLYPKGLHHISKLGENLTLIDGKRNDFVPHKIIFSLARVVRKLKKYF